MYGKYARNRLLAQLINQSVIKEEYDVAYEVLKRFLGDLLKARSLNFYDHLMQQFR